MAQMVYLSSKWEPHSCREQPPGCPFPTNPPLPPHLKINKQQKEAWRFKTEAKENQNPTTTTAN